MLIYAFLCLHVCMRICTPTLQMNTKYPLLGQPNMGVQLQIKINLYKLNNSVSVSLFYDRLNILVGMTSERSQTKKSRSGNNNMKSLAKIISVGLSSIGKLLCFICRLLKRASGIATTLIPVTRCSPCCVKRNLKKYKLQSHYILVSLKGHHIIVVLNAFASCSIKVIVQIQHKFSTHVYITLL